MDFHRLVRTARKMVERREPPALDVAEPEWKAKVVIDTTEAEELLEALDHDYAPHACGSHDPCRRRAYAEQTASTIATFFPATALLAGWLGAVRALDKTAAIVAEELEPHESAETSAGVDAVREALTLAREALANWNDLWRKKGPQQ